MNEMKVTLTKEMLDGDVGRLTDCIGARAIKQAYLSATGESIDEKFKKGEWFWGGTFGRIGTTYYESYIQGKTEPVNMIGLTKEDIGKEITFKRVEK